MQSSNTFSGETIPPLEQNFTLALGKLSQQLELNFHRESLWGGAETFPVGVSLTLLEPFSPYWVASSSLDMRGWHLVISYSVGIPGGLLVFEGK